MVFKCVCSVYDIHWVVRLANISLKSSHSDINARMLSKWVKTHFAENSDAVSAQLGLRTSIVQRERLELAPRDIIRHNCVCLY